MLSQKVSAYLQGLAQAWLFLCLLFAAGRLRACGAYSFYFSPLCYSKLSWHSTHPHPPVSEECRRDWRHPWGVQEERYSVWERYKVGRQEAEVVVKGVIFMMRLMNWLNPLSSNVRWINTEYTKYSNNRPVFWHFI